MTEAWIQWEGHVVNGEFPLKKYLGGSDQSAVFLTENRGQEPEQAAIKLIPADPANAERQLSRWWLAQRLSHPNLVRLLRTGRCRLGASDFIFAVMEYGEENLAEILSARSLTPQESREVLAPALDALAYLHARGFVYDHLKPVDIMAVKDQLKLASDGLCGASETVSIPGNLALYDPPERARGGISPAANIWSLGMILAEALTQRLPTWSQEDTADPVLPGNLPAPFLEIVRGCLRREPRDRWTIADIAQRLHPTSASPKPAPKHEDQPASVSAVEAGVRRFALPVVVAVLAVAALLAGLTTLRRKPEVQPAASAVKPPQKQKPQGTGKPSPITGDRQPGSGGSPGSAPAPGLQPRPASLRSETPTPETSRSPDMSGVVRQVLPDVPQTASDTIQGTLKVSVRVNVDPSGSVMAAELDSPGPSRYFARLALAAAQNWKFAPYDHDVVREFIVHFEFRNSGPRAFATRTAP